MLEVAGVVGEDMAIGMIGKKFGELHKALCMVEYTAREGKAACRHGAKARSVVESVIVAVDEPRFEFMEVLRCEAKLLTHANGNPGTLRVSGLEVHWEGAGAIVDSTQPDLEGITKPDTAVLECSAWLEDQSVTQSGRI